MSKTQYVHRKYFIVRSVDWEGDVSESMPFTTLELAQDDRMKHWGLGAEIWEVSVREEHRKVG